MNIVEPIGIRGRRMRPAFTIAIVLVLGLVAELAWTLSHLGEAQDAHWAKEAYERADVYYIDWDITTAAGLGPDTLRRAAQSKYVVRDGKALAKLLRTLQLQYEPMRADRTHANPPGDYRLVIDLVGRDGETTRFAANRFDVIRLADGASRPIDDAFRKRFASGRF